MSKDNKLSARILKRVLVLLALDKRADTGLSYKQIASALDTTAVTIAKIAKDYASNGLDYTVSYHYNPASRREPKVNGGLEAYVIQFACGKATEGYADWTWGLLTREANKTGVQSLALVLQRTF